MSLRPHLINLKEKKCSKCKEIKKVLEFGLQKLYGPHKGYYSYTSKCNICTTIMCKERYHKNIEKSRKRSREEYTNSKTRRDYKYFYNIKTKYNASKSWYLFTLTKQGHKCAICETTQKEHNKRLAVDHSHNSGKLRGLLCANCNTAIGLLKEDEEIFMKALSYLKSFQ